MKGSRNLTATPLPPGSEPAEQDRQLMNRMTTRAFSNIFRVVLIAFVFTVIQTILLKRVCEHGMAAATNLENNGIPNLNHLANLREDLVLFQLGSYEYVLASDSQRVERQKNVHKIEHRMHEELKQLAAHYDADQGQKLTRNLEQAVTNLSLTFDEVRPLAGKDLARAVALLDRELPQKIEAVNRAADAFNQFGYTLSSSQAKANFDGFEEIKSKAFIFGTANLIVALGLVIFVAIAASKTRRQQAEALERIQQQNRQLRLQASALNAAANAIIITNREGIIQWVNPAFTSLTGYSQEEAIGNKTKLLNSGKQSNEFYAEMWKTINSGAVWNGELINCRKGGSLYHEEMNITPVHNDDGVIQNFIAIKHDISNRIRVQQELENEKKLLCSLMDNLPDFIYFKDLDCRFIRINLALARHWGLKQPEDAIGKTDAEYVASWHQVRQRRVDEQRMMMAGKPIIGQIERTSATTGICWISSTKVPLRDETGKIIGLVGVSRDITAHKQAETDRLEMQSRYRMLFESSMEAVLIADEKALVDCNSAAMKMFGFQDKSEILFRSPAELSPPCQPDGTPSQPVVNQRVTKALTTGTVQSEWFYQRSGGEIFPAAVALTPFLQGNKHFLQVVIRDLTEIKRAEKERQLMEVQLRQSQKLESIGQLAAGIAHEINTPTQYVGDNTRFLKDAFGSIIEMMHDYDRLAAAAKAGPVSPEQIAQLEEAFVTRDMEFLYIQIPTAIQETLEGVDRVTRIVRAMKEFSHPGGKEKSLADINKAIESTATVARNEWKYVADLTLELAPDLPPVPCFLGEFNQAMLNLIVNAAHAIGDVVKKQPGTRGKITIRSQCVGEEVEIRVADTGTGIDEKYRAKIFEPFFTTKDVGKGTGQGLTVVYSSIVKKHGGTVAFETEVGRGTTFILRLPLNAPVETTAAPAAQN